MQGLIAKICPGNLIAVHEEKFLQMRQESLSLLTYSILLHILYYEGTEHQHIDNLENLLKYYKICNSYKQHKEKADKGALKRLWSKFCKEVLKIFPQVC